MARELSTTAAAATTAATEDRERGDWPPSIVTESVLRAYVKDHRLREAGWQVPDPRERELAP